MKKKGVFFALGISASLIAGFAISANNSILPAKATKGAGDETWYLLGERNGWGSDELAKNQCQLVYTKTDSYASYLLEIELEANEEFKIYNGSVWIGYDGNTGGGIGAYLSKSDVGDNFIVKEAGKYIISIIDNNVAAYGCKSSGMTISEAEWYLSYYNDGVEVDAKRITMAKNEHNPFEFVANMAAFAQNDEWKIHSKLGKVWIDSYSFSHEWKMTYTSGANVVVNEAGNYTVTMNYLNNTSYINWIDPFTPGYYLVGTAGINKKEGSSWQNPENAVIMADETEDTKVQKVARGIYIPAGAEFGIRIDTKDGSKADVEWVSNTKYNNPELIGADKDFTIKEGSQTNMVCNTEGTYDIYYKVSGYDEAENGTVWLALNTARTTAEQFASKFLNDTAPICGITVQSTRLEQLKTAWAKFADDFKTLPEAEQTILKEATADTEGTTIQKAMARYDLIVGRYGESNTPNFINRTIVKGSNNITVVNAYSATTTVIIVASIVSLVALVVFLNKKKTIR